MFGYVMPVKGEMKMREFEAYRAMYCGVCKQLQSSYGVGSRFLLNYDMVLLGLVSDAVNGSVAEIRCEGCFANPLQKRHTGYGTPGLQLAADGLMLLSYHKLMDNLADEKWPKRFAYRLAHPFFARWCKKAARRIPEAALVIEAQMKRQAALEAAGCASVDEAADPTARMCEALFAAAAPDEESKRILSRLGLFCGQVVYLLDAAEDFDDDEKNGSYNVFLRQGLTRAEAVQAAQRRCRMAAGEIALCYNLLPLCQHKEILDNIFFLGLPAGIQNAGVKRTGRRPLHGQIESV